MTDDREYDNRFEEWPLTKEQPAPSPSETLREQMNRLSEVFKDVRVLIGLEQQGHLERAVAMIALAQIATFVQLYLHNLNVRIRKLEEASKGEKQA